MKILLNKDIPILLTIAGLFGMQSAALAQQGGQATKGIDVIEEIMVTASRREERIIDVPVALTVFDATTAVQNGVTDINAMADFVPGLQATDGGAPGLGNLVIRGIYVGGAPTVGMYIGDVPFGGVVGSFASSLALDASLYDLDRIEVVRGPQGTLYGASSVGGVVRYVPKSPSLDELDGYVSADFSDTDKGGNNMLVRGRISAPIVGDKFAVSVSGYTEDNGGFIDNGITGETDIDSFDYWGGRLAARWAVSETFELEGSIFHHEADYGGASYETFDASTGMPLFGSYATEFAAPRTLDFDLYSLTAELDLPIGTLTSVTSDQSGVFENVSDVTAVFGPLVPPGTTVLLSAGSDTDRFTQELRLTSDSDGPIEWIVGAYYTKQDNDDFQITIENPATTNLVSLNTRQEYTELALFGNLTYAFTDQWDVTVGLRYSDNENKINQNFTGALSNPLLNDLNTVTDDTVTTWLINTRYRASDALNFYGRAASGYRPGGSNLVVDVGGTIFGSPSYAPDNLWSYEAGIKGRIADGRLTYDVGVYLIDWSDAQIQFGNAVGLTETSNATGDIEASGIEASLSGELFDNFFLSATLSIADAELKQDEPNLGALAGESVYGNPESTASIAADYIVPLSSSELKFGATWRQTGKYTSNFSQAATGTTTNSSYSQIDVRAGIQFEQFSVNVYGTNLSNELGYQTIFATTPTFAYGVPLRPRTFGINLRYDF